MLGLPAGAKAPALAETGGLATSATLAEGLRKFKTGSSKQLLLVDCDFILGLVKFVKEIKEQ